MKTNISIALAMTLILTGCGERIASRPSDVPTPQVAPSPAKQQSAAVPAAAQNAPAEEREQRTAPDFKDSAGTLDRSK